MWAIEGTGRVHLYTTNAIIGGDCVFTNFIILIIHCCRKYEFDGLDLHWQYPAEQHGIPADKENFVHLLKVYWWYAVVENWFLCLGPQRGRGQFVSPHLLLQGPWKFCFPSSQWSISPPVRKPSLKTAVFSHSSTLPRVMENYYCGHENHCLFLQFHFLPAVRIILIPQNSHFSASVLIGLDWAPLPHTL